MTTTDPIAEQLAEWRDRYANRRTVPWAMLDHAEQIVRASVAYHERQARATVAEVEERLAVLEEQHARELERAAEREARALDRAERAEAAEKAYRQQQTNLREQRETVDDGVQVRIEAPRVPGYGDRTHPRPWTLGELETLMYRLRSGGAMDDTEVRFKHEHAEACIPFPEMVLEAPRRPVPVQVGDGPPRSVTVVSRAAAHPLLVLGLVLAVLAIVVGVVIW